MAVILCYGDSNTHGTLPVLQVGAFRRYPPGDRWPDAMARALPGHQVIAEGLPGRCTVHDDRVEGHARNGLAVLPAILGSHAPLDLVVLMLGTNDLKTRFSMSAFEIARALERLVGVVRIEAPTADVMLVAPAPVAPTGGQRDAFAGAETRQIGLAHQIAAAADRQGCGFVDAGAHVTVSDVDGVHWDAQSHRAFGAVMARAVAGRLAGAGSP